MKTNHSCALAILFCTAIITTTQAASPAWWATQGVTNGQPADDYAIANHGQLKNMTKGVIAQLNVQYAAQGGAGTTLTALLTSWTTPVPPTVEDYAQLNSGQLKEVVKVVYDRLVQVGAIPVLTGATTAIYPWTATTADDESFSLVNIGQIKQVFNFEPAPTSDRDNDGISDLVELVYTNTDPANADSDGDGLADGLEDFDGDGIVNADEISLGFSPLFNEVQQVGAKNLFTYDRLARVKTEKSRTAPIATITVDGEGNINSVQ